MQKAYSRINWENYPSENTPLNESNLNRLDYATDEIDNRVLELDTTKLNVQDAAGMITDVSVNNNTGVITLTKKDGSQTTINTYIGKIAINFSYDRTTQELILELKDGTSARISLASFIQDNEFVDTDTVSFTVDVTGKVTANVKNYSIGDQHLQRNYLADIRTSEANARQSESNSEANATLSESWAHGGTNTRQNEDINNSEYFCTMAQAHGDRAEQAKQDAQNLVDTANARLTGLTIIVNYTDGNLWYDIASGIMLNIDSTTGNLMWEITTT